MRASVYVFCRVSVCQVLPLSGLNAFSGARPLAWSNNSAPGCNGLPALFFCLSFVVLPSNDVRHVQGLYPTPLFLNTTVIQRHLNCQYHSFMSYACCLPLRPCATPASSPLCNAGLFAHCCLRRRPLNNRMILTLHSVQLL